MKFLLFALLACGVLCSSDLLPGTESTALNQDAIQSSAILGEYRELFSQLDELEIITLFLPYDPIDQAAVNRGIAESFKKMGALTVEQPPSFIQTLLESPPKDSVCCILMDKMGKDVEVCIRFMREDPTDPTVTNLPIWGKNLRQKCAKGQEEQTIVRLASQLMKQLIKMRTLASDGSKKELKMQMRQCESF